MNEQQTIGLLNKSVKIFLSNNCVYTGKIVDVSDDFITLIDKYDDRVLIKSQFIVNVVIS
jgi:hypothetical protein